MKNLLIWYERNLEPKYFLFEEKKINEKLLKIIHNSSNKFMNHSNSDQEDEFLWIIKAAITDNKTDCWFPKYCKKYSGLLFAYKINVPITIDNSSKIISIGKF